MKHFIIPNVGLFHVKHFGQSTSAEGFSLAFIFSGFDRRVQTPFPSNRAAKTAGQDGKNESWGGGRRFPLRRCGRRGPFPLRSAVTPTTRTTFRRGGGGGRQKGFPSWRSGGEKRKTGDTVFRGRVGEKSLSEHWQETATSPLSKQ